MNYLQKLYSDMIKARKHYNQIKRANVQGCTLTAALENLASATNAYTHAFRRIFGI